MAHRVNFFFLVLTLIFLYLANTSYSFTQPKLLAFIHPIKKDKATSLYFIPLSIGNIGADFAHNFVVDLNGASPLLLNCAAAAKSASYHPIKCGSTRCKYANPNFSSCPKNLHTTPCRSSDNSRLFRDTVPLLYTTDGAYTWDSEMRSNLTLTCTEDAKALKPIPSGFNGTLGLANTRLSIPSQLVSMYKFLPKVSLCLPSFEKMEFYFGGLWIGGGPFYYMPFQKDVSKIMASTPLIGNNKSGSYSGDYLIDVKSIQIGGKTIPITPRGTTQISTMAPYTVLHTSIYKALVSVFIGSAKVMAKTSAVKPFGTCFRTNGGRGVPVIELVLRGGAKWKIHGSNSLVKVNKNVVCLGFVDGGANPKYPIVIGGYQMEDNLVQFDLRASTFSFSSSLLLHNTSCSVDRFQPF